MSKPGPESSRKWHPQQEELFLELLTKPEFRPIGGKGDGVMERKDHARWGPLLSAFSEGVAHLNANLTTSAGKSLKSEFDVPMLKRKFDDFKAKYKKLKLEFKVCRHLQQGETGGADGDLPHSVQDAVDKATLQWPLFAAYHQAFGTVQRFRDDTYTEAISPAKPVAATPPTALGCNASQSGQKHRGMCNYA
jgi:hypothetical protein